MESVAVVIPNYNGKEYLDDCLVSLEKQTYRDFKVLVVDNGSQDGSVEYIRANYPDVEVLELGSNTGFANAVNEGIRNTDSKYVFLLNNDTICDKNALKSLVHTIEKKENIFSVQAKMLQKNAPDLIDDAGDYYCALGWAFAPSKDKKADQYNKRELITSACAGAALYRRDIFDIIGCFDEAHFCYLEDVDVGYRARLYGYINIMEPAALVYHVGSASSGSRHNTFKVELTAANNLYFIYKNFNVFQLIINFPLILVGIIIKHFFYTKKGLGMAHVRGLARGFSRISQNLEKRVTFGGIQILNSLTLQLELWINCVRRVR